MVEVSFNTNKREELIDITGDINKIIRESGTLNGICNIYIPHATSGIIINENADPNIEIDFLDVLTKYAPKGVFRHDRIDGNGDAHMKSALVGSSETIPFRESRLMLGTWQSIMLCEFDGPRSRRRVYVNILKEQ